MKRADRNSLHDVVQRSAARLEERGQIARSPLAQPGTAFTRQPGDILISRRDETGAVRGKETALAIARSRNRGSVYRGSDARWFVFSTGQGLAEAVTTERARRNHK